MSASPIEMPGYPTIPVLTLPEALAQAPELSWHEKREARERNDLDYEVTVNVLGLPVAAHQVDWDAVRVTSADIGVLAVWLEEKGGEVSRLDTGHGVTVWTLSTVAGADEGYVGCRVLVTVPVAESGWVPFEVSSKAVAV